MNDKYQIIEKDIELRHEYNSNACTTVLSSDAFTGLLDFNFKVSNPLVILRKLDFVNIDKVDDLQIKDTIVFYNYREVKK